MLNINKNLLKYKAVYRRKKSIFSVDEKKINTLTGVLKNIVKYIFYFIGLIMVLDIFDINTSSILATAGIGGLAIGFGAQSLVKDIITGFFILFEDQFSVGEYIDVDDKSGVVESVELRVTKIRDFNGDLYIIPNGSIREVTNHSRGNIRILVDIDIANDENADKAILVIKETCEKFKKENKNVVDGPDVLGITQLKETGTTIRIVGKAKPMTQWDVEIELRKKIKDELDKENIRRAYPMIRISKEE